MITNGVWRTIAPGGAYKFERRYKADDDTANVFFNTYTLDNLQAGTSREESEDATRIQFSPMGVPGFSRIVLNFKTQERTNNFSKRRPDKKNN